MLEREACNCAFFAKSERDTDRANCNASPPREIFYFCAGVRPGSKGREALACT